MQGPCQRRQTPDTTMITQQGFVGRGRDLHRDSHNSDETLLSYGWAGRTFFAQRDKEDRCYSSLRGGYKPARLWIQTLFVLETRRDWRLTIRG
jgi:hypothetical protein